MYRFLVAIALPALSLLAFAATALAAPPTIDSTSFAGSTETTASLQALVNPNGSTVALHFEYVDQAGFDASGFEGAQSAPVPDAVIPATVKGSGDLLQGSPVIHNLATTAGTFAAGQSIAGAGIPPETKIDGVATDPLSGEPELHLTKNATATASGASLTATGSQPFSITPTGLTPGSAYHYRLLALNKQNPAEKTTSAPALFYTLAAPPAFGPCPNDAFRSGDLAPSGQPSAQLPDCRAYEQASPVDKDGGDVLGERSYVKAAASGARITFGSAFGIPGGVGAQAYPFFISSRGEGDSGWSTRGLLPPAGAGQRGSFLRGFSPDLSDTFAPAERLTEDESSSAFFELHSDGAPPTQITPYIPETGVESFESDAESYAYAGASADGSTVIFEARVALPAQAAGGPPLAGAVPGAANVYAWDAQSGEVHLASVMNTEAETEEALAKGAFAGPYNFYYGATNNGGPNRGYYTIGRHAVSEDGSVFFTAAGTAQLYERLNPTRPQSHLNGQGECDEPDKACTIHISAGHRTPTDPAGSAPAAFQAASADGSEAFFTSSELLTGDANTGPEQHAASIGKATVGGEEATEVDESVLPKKALGMATSPDGRYLYWASPATHSIGRVELDSSGNPVPASADDEFIDAGKTEAITQPEKEPGVYHSAPTSPRYVAVDAEHVYWTNTGPLGNNLTGQQRFTVPIEGGGTIGRATLDSSGQPEVVKSEWIKGASNPQGIAVDEEYIYWANAAEDRTHMSVARATIDGNANTVEMNFFNPSRNPGGNFALEGVQGLAVDATHVYVADNSESPGRPARLIRFPREGPDYGEPGSLELERGNVEKLTIGPSVRSIALLQSDIYWASGGNSIGRSPATEFKAGFCLSLPHCESEYLKLQGAPVGLATDPSSHLYFSLNGESQPNPGNDLYRYHDGALEDLTADPTGDGAEVQGILGASEDGSYLYFVANGVLAAGAEPGDCREASEVASGSCSLYLRHGGQTSFIARLSAQSDANDWRPTPVGPSGTGQFKGATVAVSHDGQTLLFGSTAKLTAYDNHGVSEFYLHRAGEPSFTCLTCNPSGAAPTGTPTLFNAQYPATGPRGRAVSVPPRSLTDGGRRFFFQSDEALVGADTNGREGCPHAGVESFACQDVYEWEAPGTGSCAAPGPAYSPLNEGCIYLVSSGRSDEPSYFADASESGDDAFLFTRQGLVGQDTDQIQDVYDARVGGGLAAQNPQPRPECEAEGCKPAATPPPAYQAAPRFAGPPNPNPKPPKHHRKKHRKHKKHHHRRHHHHRGAK